MIRIGFFLVVFFVSNHLSAQITYAYGKYTGTGAQKSITGLGFSPEVVIIKADDVYEAVITTNTMTAGDAKGMGSTAALNTASIKTLDADGFTVLTDNRANGSGITYYWIAFNAGTNVVTGSYTATGAAKTVNTLSFTPDNVWIWGAGATVRSDVGISLTSTNHDGMGFYTKDGSSLNWNYVNAFNGTGFVTESDATYSPVANTVVYHWIAFNDNGTVLKTNYYGGGNATDYTNGQVINPGFAPDFVIVVDKNATNVPAFRTKSVASATDKSFSFAATAGTTNRIKSFSASPTGWAIGTNASVGTDYEDYSYIAFSGGTALPVELVSFTAEKQNDEILLEWETASEKNSDHFDIMRANDSKEFEKLDSRTAAGNSSHLIYYDYLDGTPNKGFNYYKLVEYDIDGKTQESPVVAVNFTDQIDVVTELFPNPSSDKAVLYFNSQNGGVYRLYINDMSGKPIYQAQIPAMIGDNKFTLFVSDYAAGNYLLNLVEPGGKTSSTQFVKSE